MRSVLRWIAFVGMTSWLACACGGGNGGSTSDAGDTTDTGTRVDAGTTDAGPAPTCGASPTTCVDSPLAIAAAALSPGEWVEFTTGGFGADLLDVDNGSLFAFADEGVWNASTQTMTYLGAAAGGGPENAAFLCYEACGNQWTRLPLQDFTNFPVTHSYDTLAMIPDEDRFFYYRFGRRDLYEFDMATGMPPTKILVDHEVWENPVAGAKTPAITFFPEMNGLLVYQGNRGRVWIINRDRTDATLLGSIPTSVYHQFGKYDPTRSRVWLGGGQDNRQIWWVDSSGTIEAVTESPVSIGIGSAVVVLDSLTGELLVFSKDAGGTFRAYNADTDRWTTHDPSTVPFLSTYNGHGVIATALPDHCATLFVADAGVWLYRHRSL